MKRWRCYPWKFSALLLLLLAGLPVLALAVVYFADSYAELHRPAELSREVAYELSPGRGLLQVARDWRDLGLIRRPWGMVLLARLGSRGSELKAGEYPLYPGETPWRMLRRLQSGKVVQHRVTILEGWTLGELLRELRRHPRLRHDLPADAEQAAQKLGELLSLPEGSPEGRFLPETYYYPSDASDLELLRRAHLALREALREEWAGRAPELPLSTPDEALVLASIVEREALLPREQSIIAGVFIRRLRRGMRLQADPTVSYGKHGHYRHRLSRSDLQHASPYNTYRHGGLPPTPIALPSRGSIHAVLHPAEGQELYFVARGNGSHEFSRTLAEHNAAVARIHAERKSKEDSRLNAARSEDAP